MVKVSPAEPERYHLRLLLLNVKGACSYDELKTVVESDGSVKVLDMMPGEEIVYKSIDRAEDENRQRADEYLDEYLNALNPSGSDFFGRQHLRRYIWADIFAPATGLRACYLLLVGSGNRMEEIWILILVLFFATNSLDKAESSLITLIMPKMIKTELKRAGFKNSYEHEIDENVAKELGLSFATIYRWKRKLGQTTANKYAHDKQKEFLMKSYYEIKGKNPKIRDEDIAKTLKIGTIASKFCRGRECRAESVELEETPPKMFDEIFGEGWWDNGKADEWRKLTLEHNFHRQINRQNTQIGQIGPDSTDQNPPLTESDHFGQIEPNSTDQLGHIEPNSTDQLGQIKPNSTDQNPPLTESDHSVNAKNGEDQNEITSNAEDERKHKTVAKELGLSFATIYNWKRKLGQTTLKHKHSHSEQKELMNRYYEIKDKTPKLRDEEIAKMLKIGSATLIRWKRQFKRQQFYPNVVDELFVEDRGIYS
uniref:Uncharacterized protein n=1 Tax=Globodera rostochiensis TaxID=31243 RepID=A0A914H2E8_GLORO